MTKFYVAINAEDGRHRTVHADEAAARAYAAHQVGREIAADASRQVIDDWGRVISWHPMPAGINTAKQLDRLAEAYDARECGIATKAQLRLLARVDGI